MFLFFNVCISEYLHRHTPMVNNHAMFRLDAGFANTSQSI